MWPLSYPPLLTSNSKPGLMAANHSFAHDRKNGRISAARSFCKQCASDQRALLRWRLRHVQTIRSFDGHIAKGTIMDTLLIIIVLLILFGGFGGGYYGYSHYGMGGGIGILGVVLIIAVVLFIFGRGRG
jgi:hypothetical protein